MKRFLIIFLVIASLVALPFVGLGVQSLIYDTQIKELESVVEHKQVVADKLINDTYRVDAQSASDIELMMAMFDKLFTFYDINEFKKAKAYAVESGLPANFVNNFYSTAELSGMYADAMLDVICQFDSADIYLLDRDDNIGYYYVVVNLDTVRYANSRFQLAFFITMDSLAYETERFVSMLYYNIA